MDTPDRIDVVSMRTHRLLLAVTLDGTVQLDSRFDEAGTARVLHSIADHLAGRPGERVHDLITGGDPCHVHHTPPAPEAVRPCGCPSRFDHHADGCPPRQQRPATEPDSADLTAHVTEYRVPVPEAGGVVLLVRRQSPTSGVGWAVSTTAYGGGRAWTTEGWQEAVSALSVGRLFCWPDARTAVAAARRALAAQTTSETGQ
ncbi:hypothetical protein HHL19_36290 [Streptomyces sp. R302]|uniref:hypothetical protein n=1 Tax=unclassified Streptomyces TaxID=2593676 RepID=UPI00145DBEBF|nr:MULTISPECIES: hypothetical protein [unclassified Streptomyces]NML55687.1 hypothetical protein [Streptomyces sp. R301]NML83971.1 hypothetical protein [Streptomyces sp. R302]